MKCLLKVNLDDEQCKAVDAACVRQTARTGGLVNRSDLVRLWIAAGCPVVAEQVVGWPPPQSGPADEHRKARLDAEEKQRSQSPKPASASSAAAPVARQVVGAGWRELEPGEVIDKDDEYLSTDNGQWTSCLHSLCVGDKYQPFPTDTGVQHARHRRKLPAAVVAGSEKALRAEPPAASGNAGGADARPARAPIEKPKGGVL